MPCRIYYSLSRVVHVVRMGYSLPLQSDLKVCHCDRCGVDAPS
jgi:hypothetical protein